MLYAIFGIILGLVIGVSVAWPISKLLGELGLVVAPYILGVAIIIFIEFFVIEGKNIFNKLAGKK